MFHLIISGCSLKNGRIPILKDKSIGLIKWQKVGLENLLGSPCIKRRIRGGAIRDYQMGEYKNPSPPFNVAPTSHYGQPHSRIEDYELKVSITAGVSRVRGEPERFDWRGAGPFDERRMGLKKGALFILPKGWGLYLTVAAYPLSEYQPVVLPHGLKPYHPKQPGH